MGTINALVKNLNALPENIKKASQAALNKEVLSLIVDFQKRSPVDTGAYKAGWVKSKPSFSASNILAGASIVNNDPKAGIMDEGAIPGSAPWYFPNKKQKTGKLTESKGRIWAGGLKPGHALTIGGSTGPVLFNNNRRQLQIATAIADRVIKVI